MNTQNSHQKTLPENISLVQQEQMQQKGIFSHYQILKELGRGGMGIVYKAIDLALNRIVAIKIIVGKNETNETLRLQKEANALAQLDHPHIVRILEAGIQPQPYFSMEYIEGENLSSWIKQKKPGKIKLLKIFLKLAHALHYAHKKGFLHRDIKPVNIMITKDEEPKIMDFGLAKALDNSSLGGQSLSKTGDLLGTPSYMSPEQAEGENISPRSDVYSLGATLYEALTGKPPFEGDSYLSILMKIATEEVLPLRKHSPHISPYLEAICMKCLQKNQEKRYCDAKQLARDIQNYLNNRPILAKKYNIVDATKKFILRKKIACLSGACFLILLCFAVVFYMQKKEEQKQMKKNEERLAQYKKEEEEKDKKQQEINKILQEGLKNNLTKIKKLYIDKEKYAQADQEYKKLLQIYTGKDQAEIYLTKIEKLYIDRKQYDQADQEYKKLLKIYTGKEKADIYFKLGFLHHYHYKNKDDTIIQQYYQKAVEINEKNWDAYFQRGKFYFYEHQEYLKAIKQFNIAFQYCNVKNESLKILNDRGYAKYFCGKYNESIEDFTTVITMTEQKNPNNQRQVAFCRRGYVYNILGEHEKALSDLKESIKISKDNEEAFFFTGLVYLGLKDNQKARENFEQAKKCKGKHWWTKHINENLAKLKKE